MLARLGQVPVYGGQNRLEEGSLASDAFKAQNVGETQRSVRTCSLAGFIFFSFCCWCLDVRMAAVTRVPCMRIT